jgi:TPR repeat protein
LAPVDARLTDEADLRRMKRVDEIISDVQQARNLRILVLDACRDNPLAEDLRRSIGKTRALPMDRGLAKIDTAQGMIVAYATQAGRTAEDGEGRNSPYTAAFLKHIEQAEEIGTIFRRVSADVYNSTQQIQLPELSLSLIGEFYLRDKPQNFDQSPSVTPPAPQHAVITSPQTAPPLQTIPRSTDPTGSLTELRSAFDKKNFTEAAELARPLAEAGNRDAQFTTAWLFDTGRGVAQDDQKAVLWYRKAAELGSANAQYNLGIMYENGRGVPQDYHEAVFWYQKSAEQGNPEAQNDLAIMYSFGQGVSRDYRRAVYWYRMAADKGYVKAQKNLGDMYASGRGVKRDVQEAALWYRNAAEQQHAAAQFNMGYFYENGLAVQRSCQMAADWYKKALDNGNTEASKALERVRVDCQN